MEFAVKCSATQKVFIPWLLCMCTQLSMTVNCVPNAASIMAFIWEKAICLRWFITFNPTMNIYDLYKQCNLPVPDRFITGLPNLMKQETC